MSRPHGKTPPVIVTRPNSRYFYAKWRSPSGKQHFRSTGIDKNEGTVSEALEVAMAWQCATNGKRGFSNASQVRGATDDLITRLFPETSKSIDELFSGWLNISKRSGKAESTLKVYRRMLKHLREFLGDRMKQPFDSFTVADGKAFTLYLLDKGQSHSTIRNTLMLLGSAFAPEVGKTIPENPMNLSAFGIKLNHNASGKEPFTLEEVGLLLNFTRGTSWEGFLLLGFYGGQRIQDEAHLRWDQVDLVRRVISLKPDKTETNQTRIRLPIPDELHSWLMDHAGDAVGFVFPDLAKMKPNKLSEYFTDKIMIPAGVQFETIITDAGLRLKSKTYHSIRHTNLTELQSLGFSDATRAGFSGHTNQTTLNRYSHARESEMRRAAEALEWVRKESAR